MSQAPPTTKDGRPIQLGQHGQYRLLRRLRGYAAGQVEVFEASQHVIDRPVEVHILKVSKKIKPRLFDTFLETVQRLSACDHASVLSIMDVDVAGSRAFLTCPVRKSSPLAKVVARRSALPARAVSRILAELAGGLAALHENQILHPRIDLEGISLDLATGVPYFAEVPFPEDIEVIPRKAPLPLGLLAGQIRDERTDVFLLAILGLELLTGGLVYRPEPDPLTGTRVPNLHVLLKGTNLPDGLQSTLIVALEISATRRYATAADFARDLEACQRNPEVPVVNPDTMTHESAIKKALRKKQKAVQRRRKQLAVGEWMGTRASPTRKGPAPGRYLAGGLGLALLAAVPLMRPERKKIERLAEFADDISEGAPLAPAQVRREALAKANRQRVARATSTRSFDTRWRALRAYLASPEGAKNPPCTLTELVQLRLRLIRGDESAVATLDRWLAATQPASN